MTAALEVRGLRKRFGKKVALDGIDLSIPEGMVYGFLGPNGAGKTTTLRIVTGLARQDAGTVSFFGRDAGEAGARDGMGYLPDVPGFYPWMRGEEFLSFAGGLFGLRGRELSRRVEALLDLAGLSGQRTRIGGYSRGMRQRLGIAQALISSPRLLLLDEPTSALDPLGRKAVLDMIAALRGRTTVFFSTHILPDAERVCDRAAILDGGRIVAESDMAGFRSAYGGDVVRLSVEGSSEALLAGLKGLPWVRELHTEAGGAVSLSTADLPAAQREIPVLVASLGLGLRSMDSGEASLEEAFVRLVGEQKGGAK